MTSEQTFLFRVFTGERYVHNGEYLPPIYYSTTILHNNEQFRRKMAQNVVEYLHPPKSNIIRVDHLKSDSLVKLLEYDKRRYGSIRSHNH